MAGISVLHGPHQVAQKLINTGCPFKLLRAICLPLAVVRVKSGAGAPVMGAGVLLVTMPVWPLAGPLGAPRNTTAPINRPINNPPPRISKVARGELAVSIVISQS